MKKLFMTALFAAMTASFLTIGVMKTSDWWKDAQTLKIEHINTPSPIQVNNQSSIPSASIDFTQVSDQVMPAVVHIQSTAIGRGSQRYTFRDNRDPFYNPFGDEFFRRFFGEPLQREERPQKPKEQDSAIKLGTGSGVIISSDGFIVTNHHVIKDADDVEVTLHDNRTYKAKILGTDPSTDLALIQIKEKDLAYLPLANSDEVRVGEWVLAVGNPFNLNSTVTAGIVSAKGRNINILPNKSAIESFIQTDAAINPGNSGGALVNLQGGLIGINTAIASPTGSYAGYGFAVPVNLVEKVVEDLKKYGVVQRGYLGIMIRGVDGNFAKEKDLSVVNGVYVDSLLDNSAAKNAGIKVGDVILAVNDNSVNKVSELLEQIARHRPGDKIKLKVNRSGKDKDLWVTLKNQKGDTNMMKKEYKEVFSLLGAELEKIDKEKAKKLNIENGIQVKSLYAGKIRQQTRMKEGFIITKADNQEIDSIEELIKIIEGKKGGIMLEGVYENFPGTYYYAFGLS